MLNSKLYVMNSANMPQGGNYSIKEISKEEAILLLLSTNEIVSSIAYPTVCEILEKISGITVPLDKAKKLTVLQEDNCDILVCKLKFRVKAERKGKDAHKDIKNYGFYHVKYTKQ